jgi:hypothetical protein
MHGEINTAKKEDERQNEINRKMKENKVAELCTPLYHHHEEPE